VSRKARLIPKCFKRVVIISLGPGEQVRAVSTLGLDLARKDSRKCGCPERLLKIFAYDRNTGVTRFPLNSLGEAEVFLSSGQLPLRTYQKSLPGMN
jgi:hypothetical protein